MVVISNEHKNGLKGQPILAQGKRRRSVTLGLETGRKIVRAMALIKKQFSFRTKWIGSCFIEKNVLQFRPKEAFCLEYHVSSDGILGASFTQGDVWIVPPKLCPGLEYIGLSDQNMWDQLYKIFTN
jgi:hypothetical protein